MSAWLSLGQAARQLDHPNVCVIIPGTLARYLDHPNVYLGQVARQLDHPNVYVIIPGTGSQAIGSSQCLRDCPWDK